MTDGTERQIHDFDAMCCFIPDIGRPQPAFVSLAESGLFSGKVLDIGCGTGEHALLASSHGHEAVGIDTSPRAIELAKQKAAERGISARFLVWDALDLPALGEQFDTVLDCGLFHVFNDGDREHYVVSLAAVVAKGGRYFMLCFSDRQPGDWGPRRVTEKEIRMSFADGWRIDSIQPTVLDIRIDPDGTQAWLASISRV
jgi:SAM-dependent methyltransferase